MTSTHYVVRRESRSSFIQIRGLKYHLRHWGDPASVTAERPPLIMMHGWMDVGASFQFVVDCLSQDRYVVAADWRGFGLTETPNEDSYWFADYLGDLDAIVDTVLKPFDGLTQIDLVGHSMGGNVVMLYGGLLAGFAPSVGLLVACRVVQGIGTAMLITNSAALVTAAFPRRLLGQGLGIYMASFSLAQLLGPTLGAMSELTEILLQGLSL